jgi:hypothetical protein
MPFGRYIREGHRRSPPQARWHGRSPSGRRQAAGGRRQAAGGRRQAVSDTAPSSQRMVFHVEHGMPTSARFHLLPVPLPFGHSRPPADPVQASVGCSPRRSQRRNPYWNRPSATRSFQQLRPACGCRRKSGPCAPFASHKPLAAGPAPDWRSPDRTRNHSGGDGRAGLLSTLVINPDDRLHVATAATPVRTPVTG